jgi:hypothetical protein
VRVAGQADRGSRRGSGRGSRRGSGRGSGHGSRAGRGACTSRAWIWVQKTRRKLHRRVAAREAFSGFDFSGGASS